MRLTASFSPEHLGKGTTVHVGLRITTPAGRPSSPVREVQILYPAGLGIATSGLGLESCTSTQLEHGGAEACPPNALMGHGSALVEVPFGPHTVLERAPITIFSAPVEEESAGLLLYASGDFPVIANLVFRGRLLSAGGRYGGLIDTRLPLVPSVPDGPDVALVGLNTTIGPQGITYFEQVAGKTIRFTPNGLLLPRRCPRGGFAFGARLLFEDGTRAGGGTAVGCPGGPARRNSPNGTGRPGSRDTPARHA